MKLPAVWMVAAFAAGIALSEVWPHAPWPWIAAAALGILLGAVFAWRKRIVAAGAVALIVWVVLGGLALAVERATVPANHVSRLLSAGRIETNEPLRWRGRLREDPASLPWGRRYVIDLEQVETAGLILPVVGGLRANLYGDAHLASGPEGLRAGDRIEALIKARRPRNFLDPGSFDARGYLAGQGIDLTGSLRSGELLQLIDHPTPTLRQRLVRARGKLLARLETMLAGQPDRAAVLRAMLLGDRSFVDSDVVTAFQKTAAYHVLVVAGLHVGALVVFLFWFCRWLRFSIGATTLVTLAALAAYVGVVEDRPPIFRAALMAALYLCSRPLFRRIELANTVALAALVILLARPASLADSSFQLSFLAAGVIAGIAMPWIDRTSAPYRAGLRHLGDVTRDGAQAPKIAQFRIEMRGAISRVESWFPAWLAPRADSFLVWPIRAGLRLWEIVLLSVVIQWGMIPLLALDFHRVSLVGPVSNIPAVILTGFIVPLRFLALGMTFIWGRLALILGKAVAFCAGLLLATTRWFSAAPHMSYRIPGPPVWLIAVFLIALFSVAAAARAGAAWRMDRTARRQLSAPIAAAEWISAVVLAALTVLVAWHPFAPALERGRLEVSVLDIGQGDSIFTAFPGGRTMLIDGGGLAGSEWVGGYRSGVDVGEEVVSPYLWSRGLKRLDVVALTHAHHDHMDGLRSVLENFRVGELWIGRDEETLAFKSFLAEARSLGIPIIHQAEGGVFNWDGVRGEVLWPPDAGPMAEASNDDSLVLRLMDGSVRFLLAGDIQERVEERLVADRAPLAADFLKVPHHGSKTSSTPAFLSAVEPRVAVISVGEANPFGHPSEDVIERYERAGVRLLRTDRDGAVTALTDGRSVAVHAFADKVPLLTGP